MTSVNTYYTTEDKLKLFLEENSLQDNNSLLVQIFTNTDIDKILIAKLTTLLPNAVIIESSTDSKILNNNSFPSKILLNFIQFEHTLPTPVNNKNYQQYQKLKERLELALIGNNDGIWDWNIIDQSIYFSSRWKEMLGYNDHELPNELATWNDRIHPEDLERTWDDVYKNINKETEYYENVHRLKHKEGHWVWILDRGKTLYNKEGEAIRMIGTHTDITKEKREQLKHVFEAQVVEQIYESIIITDMDGNIVKWNKKSENLFGFTTDEVNGKYISILYQEKDKILLKKIKEILYEEGVYNLEIDLVKKSKETISIYLSLTLLKDDHNNPIGYVGINQDITDQKQEANELYKQKNILNYKAHYDALTDLPNRLLFTDRLEQGIKKSIRQDKNLVLFFIDLDKFKDINDSLGHQVGDRVLQIVADRLKSTIRSVDTLSRLSGDEFTVIMENLSDNQYVTTLAEKLLQVLAKPIYIDQQPLYLSASIGISLYPTDASNAHDLLKYADTAMYKAKEGGRNNYQFYSADLTQSALERMLMKTHLKEAIDKDEFVIYYQPQIDSEHDTLNGLEALIRWEHPTKGILLPSHFIPLAEETGLIVEIDKLVMRRTIEQVSHWYATGLFSGVIALNLSIKQLESKEFIEDLTEILKTYNFRSEWLELELSESQMMQKPEESISKLEELNRLGIKISIDDFGTGYSSLSVLKRLPIHRLKIDRSFIKDVPKDDESVGIVQAVIALAQSLKIGTISEGVETIEQKEFLLHNGCNNVQGYYYAYPMSGEETHKFLLENSLSKKA